MRIYLMGMPGSGKTTLGKSLARHLAYDFVDLDERIVQAAGMPIHAIFAQHRESHFRELEQAALQQTFTQENIVVATGGGAPCFFDNLEQMNRQGITVFLHIPLEKLTERLFHASKHAPVRPLVAGKSRDELRETLAGMQKKRTPFYERAQVPVTAAKINASEIVRRIQEHIKKTPQT